MDVRLTRMIEKKTADPAHQSVISVKQTMSLGSASAAAVQTPRTQAPIQWAKYSQGVQLQAADHAQAGEVGRANKVGMGP